MGATIGLVSCTVALIFGFFFFSYAVKYYASTLIALLTLSNGAKKVEDVHYEERSEDPNSFPKISIHLPFYNEKNVAARIINACLNLDYPNYEVLIVDDSRDETIEILKNRKWLRKHPVVKFVHRSDRSGFKGGALTEALRCMDPRVDFVVIFDADFIPPRKILRHFLSEFQERLKDLGNNNPLSPSHVKPTAVVQGYQLHYLNKSYNWLTKGVRAEFSGSYMVERVAEEHFDALKMVSGSVFMIRADVLRSLNWSTSITEDWELTLRLYLEGFKVAYTPLIQAPAEIPTTVKALAKQRMRWAEGHTYSVKKYFTRILKSNKLTLSEKLEFLYFAPYYFQSLMLLIGTVCWLIAEINHKSPWFWTSSLGWSLLLTNFLAAPIMSLTGLFLEGDIRSDFDGVFSLIVLTYILAPYQGLAALKGLLEKEEGTWIRTLKTGSVTDKFLSIKLRRLLSWIRFGERLRHEIKPLKTTNPYLPIRRAFAGLCLILMFLPLTCFIMMVI